MENRKTLTIAIPTYNRKGYLKQCLDSIYCQNEYSNIDVVVNDNGSTDGTEKFVKEYIELNKICNLHYYRNDENLGPDKNFLLALSRSGARYTWLFSDDDCLCEHVLEKVIGYLQYKDYSFVEVNTTPFVAYNPRMKEDGLIEYSKNQIYEFYNKMNIYLTFMSTMIFNTDILKSIVNKEQYIGSYFLQTALVIESISSSDLCAAIFTDICVKGREDNSGGYNFCQVFIYSWEKILSLSKKDISNRQFRKIYNYTLKHFICGTLAKIKCEKNSSFKSKMDFNAFKTLLKYRNGVFLVIPIYILPVFVVRWLIRIKGNNKQNTVQ